MVNIKSQCHILIIECLCGSLCLIRASTKLKIQTVFMPTDCHCTCEEKCECECEIPDDVPESATDDIGECLDPSAHIRVKRRTIKIKYRRNGTIRKIKYSD